MSWRVFMNGKDLGIVESNFAWASVYWKSRCTDDRKFKLVKE
jgi:hypothetical protein